MASLAAELSSVLQEAISALEQEDNNDLAAAIDTYYKLKSQLKYVLDMKMEPTQDGALATVCRGLAESYDIRIEASEQKTCMQACTCMHFNIVDFLPIVTPSCCRCSGKSSSSKL